MDAHLAACAATGSTGLIMTMTADDPKWSFVELDDAGRVDRVVEKVVVSDEATVGIYTFAPRRRLRPRRRGDDRRRRARQRRVLRRARLQPADRRGRARSAIDNIGAGTHGMYGLGIPADLERFLAGPRLQAALAA